MSSMVIAYHLIMTAYGWWLHNDPRGSTSKHIASDIIAELGELHFGRKRVQPASRDIRRFYRRAAEVLKFPLLSFDENARSCIAEAFKRRIMQHRYTCYGCAILWDHIHLLIRKHKHLAEDMIENFQRISAELLRARGFRCTKEFAQQLIARLPHDATMEDIQYSLYVAELVRQRKCKIDDAMKHGLEHAIRRGKLIPHKEVVKQMKRLMCSKRP